MKYFALLFLCLFLLLTACNNKDEATPFLFKPGNLKSNFISLIADSAYTLKTPNGAIIKISQNSFAVAASSKLQLEIKEAYTLQDIILAGLSTESNGKLLKSGGMIYINAFAGGKAVELVKPIQVSIPTEVYDDKMQLFKGETAPDSSINWVDPQPLDTGATIKKLINGRVLFESNCASCHKVTMDFTGPMLAGSRSRAPSPEWPYQFTKDAARLVEKDPYARQLKNKYGSIMTSFSNLGNDDIKAILDYCDNDAALNPVQLPERSPKVDTAKSTATSIQKPCGFDTIYYSKADTAISAITPEVVNATAPEPDNNIFQKAEDTEGLRSGFTDPNPTTGMYDFQIKTLGWYNVDQFVEGYTGSTYVAVNVQLQTEVELEMHVYLFCPDKKMLSIAYDRNGNNYKFNKVDGKIPLFLNDKAVVLAFGSKTDKIYYGTASFNVQSSQTINITVKETTEAELKSFIKKNNIDGIKIDLNKKDDFKIQQKPCDEIYEDSMRVVKK